MKAMELAVSQKDRWRKILGPYRQVRRRRAYAGNPSVSRRGTCDRGIWMKPLVRRTRGAMGFAWSFRALFSRSGDGPMR